VTVPTRVARRSDGGQSTVELALLLPMLVFAALAILQVALIARDQIALGHAAREAARTASVDPDRAHATRAARTVLAGTDVTVTGGGGVGSHLTVEVRYRERTDLPLVGALFPDPELHARVVIRSER
jgi:Flp pilus assembly protein TadG